MSTKQDKLSFSHISSRRQSHRNASNHHRYTEAQSASVNQPVTRIKSWAQAQTGVRASDQTGIYRVMLRAQARVAPNRLRNQPTQKASVLCASQCSQARALSQSQTQKLRAQC